MDGFNYVHVEKYAVYNRITR